MFLLTIAITMALWTTLEAFNMLLLASLASTPPGMPGTHPAQYFGWGGRQREYPRQYYYVLLDTADQYWLPSVRSASSRFHSAIRRHHFASVRQADSRLTRLVPPQPWTRVDAHVRGTLAHWTIYLRTASCSSVVEGMRRLIWGLSFRSERKWTALHACCLIAGSLAFSAWRYARAIYIGLSDVTVTMVTIYDRHFVGITWHNVRS